MGLRSRAPIAAGRADLVAFVAFVAFVAPILPGLAACGPDWDALDPSLSDLATGSGGSGGSLGSGGGGSGGSGGAAGSGGSPRNLVEFTAVVADCVDPVELNPNDCELAAGAGTMTVDSNNEFNHPIYSFVRFDFDKALAGKTILKVTLQLVVATALKSEGDQSGEIWEVAAFTRNDLFFNAPTKVSPNALVGSDGPVMNEQIVEWVLTPDLVIKGSSVYLGVYPISKDGVDYWNRNGVTPPRLVIEYL